jgi:hypothetical protein
MRVLMIFVIALSLAACSPPPQAPTAAPPPGSAEAPAGSEYDPQHRARAVEDQTLQQFDRQNEALEKQGG